MSAAKYDFFLSYNAQDRDVVAGLAELLRSSGLTVWCDLNLRPGESYIAAVDTVIRECRAVIVCVGRHGVSDFTLDHLELAGTRSLPIVPVLLPSAGELPAALARYHAVDLQATHADAQLLHLIRSFAGSTAPTPPAPRPATFGAQVFNFLNGNNSYKYGAPNHLRLYGPYFTAGAIALHTAASNVEVP